MDKQGSIATQACIEMILKMEEERQAEEEREEN